ncbi:hypothetical protein LCGC14_0208190 [marine sediment metagenome]|uniref:Gene product 88 domain-containing protein n=1 Tax=marine sediment metagenome TaxID=412755 RepID=A0A0F9XJV3_9ZZZZ
MLLSNSRSNAKTVKMLDEFGYEAVIQYLAPDKVADGKHTMCPHSTPGCRESCLYTAGRGAMRMVQAARIRKTREFFKDRQGYTDRLVGELINLEARAIKKGYTPVARLNGTSDIQWEDYIDMEALPNIQFYDYTKGRKRMFKYLNENSFPPNYYLTYSFNEHTTPQQVGRILYYGGNVAVVFREEIPEKFWGHKVISGMEHDFRFRDPKESIVGLLARGRARGDSTGFVVD